MTTVQELLARIAELDPSERESLVANLSQLPLSTTPQRTTMNRQSLRIEFPLIVSTPSVCGGAARLIRTRIPIWTLERMRQLGVSDSEILRSFPTLSEIDLEQAWEFVARNRDEIDTAIRQNEEA